VDIAFTDRELDVMAVLWQLGSAKVSEVRDRLKDDLAYTTVLTVLQKLEQKGYVTHEEVGRAYRYSSRVPRDLAGRSALRRIASKMYGGSAELLLAELVSDRGLSDEMLRRMSEVLGERLDERRK
jgi:predicted transcriptional regulator